jgi:hypothetical protein
MKTFFIRVYTIAVLRNNLNYVVQQTNTLFDSRAASFCFAFILLRAAITCWCRHALIGSISQVNTCDEVLVTEMIFNNVLTDLTAEQVWAHVQLSSSPQSSGFCHGVMVFSKNCNALGCESAPNMCLHIGCKCRAPGMGAATDMLRSVKCAEDDVIGSLLGRWVPLCRLLPSCQSWSSKKRRTASLALLRSCKRYATESD